MGLSVLHDELVRAVTERHLGSEGEKIEKIGMNIMQSIQYGSDKIQ